jgi:hypothetical protein
MRVFAIAGFVVAAVQLGCSGPCKQVQAEWAAVRASRPPAEAAHLRLQVPYAEANRLITSVLGETIEVPLRLDALALVAPELAGLRLVAREVALEPGPPGRVRFTVRVELIDDRGLLLGLRAVADAAPDLELGEDGGSAVTLGLRADQLVTLEPELGARAAAALGTALVARVPSLAKTPKLLVDRGAARVVEELVERGHGLVRTTLLTRLGELTRLRFEIPAVPVQRIELGSLTAPTPALELALFTALPVRDGVAAAVPAAGGISVHVSGSAAAELANWAIEEGHAPRRYTRKLQPDDDGPYRPHFDWRAGQAERPLLVHLFALEGKGCAHFAAGARPHVEVEGGKVHGRVENRKLERSVGPPLLALLADLNGFFQRSVSRTRSAAASTRLTVGGRPVDLVLTSAEVTSADVHLGFAIRFAE